jgi:hypothetical protein
MRDEWERRSIVDGKEGKEKSSKLGRAHRYISERERERWNLGFFCIHSTAYTA